MEQKVTPLQKKTQEYQPTPKVVRTVYYGLAYVTETTILIIFHYPRNSH